MSQVRLKTTDYFVIVTDYFVYPGISLKTLKGEQAALIKQIFTVLTLRFIRIPFEFTCDSSLLQTNVRVPSAASAAFSYRQSNLPVLISGLKLSAWEGLRTSLDNVLFNSERRSRNLNRRNAMLAVKSTHQSCVVLQKEVITHSLII